MGIGPCSLERRTGEEDMPKQWEQSPNLKIAPKEKTYNFLVKSVKADLPHLQMFEDIPQLISAFKLLLYFDLRSIFPNVSL